MLQTLIRFEFDGLSLAMRVALSWLIDVGGTARVVGLISGANAVPHGSRPRFGRTSKVTKATIDALVKRGHLDLSEDRDNVQISRYAVGEACKHLTNPHPEPIMQVRAEALARRDNADRVAREIRDIWLNHNNTEGNHV